MTEPKTDLSNILPESPNARLDANCAVPSSAAKELGDYAEGDYAVAVKTQDAPDVEDSHFARTSREMSAS